MFKTWNVKSGNVIDLQPIFSHTHRKLKEINLFQDLTKSPITSLDKTETKKAKMSYFGPK